MIGPKKLSTIRQELRRELAATGEDPIRWLEERLAALHRQGTVVSGESDLLHSLQRFVEAARRGKRRKQQTGAKK